MKKKYYFTACLFSITLLSACSNLEDAECDVCGNTQETVAQPYSVSFKLGGSVGTASSRAASVTQTDEEKELKSLYAVVFADPDASNLTDRDTGHETAEDLFVAAIYVDLKNYNSGSATTPNLSFVLGEQGHYNICFVANPSKTLEDAIKGLETTQTVSDFEKLVEESAPDLESSFLMTSPFYAVTTAYLKPATIPIVNLTRAVARIDVVNKADGVTVQKLVFHNYAAKSRLISDGSFSADYIEKTKEYAIGNGGLVGNSTLGSENDQNYYGQKIYTYEQFADTGDDAATSVESRPSLEIIYTVPSLTTGQWFTHTVMFETAATDSPATVVPLKRNYHYLVTLTNNNGKINFTLSVKDWDQGYTFENPSSDFADGTQSSQQSGSSN